MGGVGLAAAVNLNNNMNLGAMFPKFGFGVTIWNLDPNNDIKITAPYFDTAYVPGDAGRNPDTWQDTIIPKATPTGAVLCTLPHV